MVKYENVVALVNEILVTDPIPFDTIGVQSDDTLKLVMTTIWEQYQTKWKCESITETEEIMLAVIVKLVMENFFLHTFNLKMGHSYEELKATQTNS